jgi:hypothetical protein
MKSRDASPAIRRAYKAASNARSRCENPKHPDYPNYGGRGIRFLFPTLAEFVRHVATLPCFDDPERSVDRIDNNASYAAGNLRYATRAEQAANRRCSRKAA